MNILEQAASLIEDDMELINEGKLSNSRLCVRDKCKPFFLQLEQPGTKIFGTTEFEKIKNQYKRLDRIAEFNNLKIFESVTAILDILKGVIDRGQSSKYINIQEFIKWPGLLSFIIDNADRIAAQHTITSQFCDKLVSEYYADKVDKAYQKSLNTQTYRHKKKIEDEAAVKEVLSNFAENISMVSDGRFDIVKQASKSAAPIIIDNKNCLQLTARDYSEWAALTGAENSEEFLRMVENMFKNNYDRMLGKSIIPKDIVFSYKQDAMVACDYSMLTNKKNEYGGWFDAGIRRTSDRSVVHFANAGHSLRSTGDYKRGTYMDQSRYINVFSDDDSTLRVYLNGKEKFEPGYLDKDVVHAVFKIKADRKNIEYISCGSYMVQDVTDDCVIYERISDTIDRQNIKTTTNETTRHYIKNRVLTEQAKRILRRAGYRIIY